jgi:hypothetical protein
MGSFQWRVQSGPHARKNESKTLPPRFPIPESGTIVNIIAVS